MSLYNHQLTFRPLRGGIEIFNESAGELGTLGFIAMDETDPAERYLVSCYHVLVGSPMRAPVDGEGILQPSAGNEAVAFVDATRADAMLDCAAARIGAAIGAVDEILGLGRLSAPAAPDVGMRVIKSGVSTGITEGVIEQVDESQIIIGHSAGFDADYDLSLAGDSGALWLRRDDLAPVGLHLRGLQDARKRAAARPIVSVLAALRLKITS